MMYRLSSGKFFRIRLRSDWLCKVSAVRRRPVTQHSPGKGTGYPAPSPQTRTSGTTASGSSILILLTKPETDRAVSRLAHNFAALLAVLDGVDDPGVRKGKFVNDRVKELFPVNVAFVRSTA